MLTEKKKDFATKFIFYIIIGVYGVLVDLAISNFFFNLPGIPENIRDNIIGMLSTGVFATLAAQGGAIAGLINNFLMNEVLVYNKERNRKMLQIRFYKYTAALIIGSFLVGNLIVFNICFSVLDMGFSTSKVIAILVGTFINYPINYFWTWGDFSFKAKEKKIISKSEE